MPPSPAMRCSPGREPRADNHKRGRSLESGVPLKQRDDDLALFNEVQNRERDNFLLQGDDDFEDIFANKLRHFSDYKLGINIPARGESSDLLHAEDEKNDYEWLITPPDTPLFPSLDDEAPQFNLAQRGRTRTQPIAISRSSPTMEKGRRGSRGSASPNRVSLSPRSHNSTFEGRHRASSAPSASPPATLRHNDNTPPAHSHRSPPPSRKPSSPVPRASTPPPRRLSTGSSNGTTTTKGIRGNSASPKVKAWQSSIPGFSTEVPPNLRTSLADRPASYVRGSSPASRSSRQSMSPTASRSIGSSHSHERDRFSSHSKGSVGSSAEDDMESLSSVLVVVGRPNSRRVGVGVGGFQNNRASPSKKPIRTISSSSAPKRSFDLALRQMDHRKGQNMFRPLLSSVPSSTFHAGIATSPYHPVISRNSSVTTSSNASSGVAISGAHDHDHEASQDDATSRYVKVQDDDHDVDDEVFMIEKDDGNDPLLDNSRNTIDRDPATLTTIDDVSDISTQKEMLICSKCGCGYSPPIGQVENDTNLCEDCMESNSSLTIIDPVTSIVVSGSEPESTTVEPQMAVVESLQVMANDLVKDGQSEGNHVNVGSVDFSNSKVESLEGAGISILLKRSSSIKGGAVVRNTNFSASSISYEDFSYVRDTTNSMRSVSATSSVDFGQSRQSDTRFQRQSSITKSEIEHSKHQRSGSSLSGTSSHVFHPSSLGTSTLDSSGKDVQENNEEENDNVDSGESLLTNILKDEESVGFQKVEDLGADDTALDSCNDDTDVAEVPLDVILEGESASPSKCDVSQNSMSSIEELREDVALSAEDFGTSNHTSNVIGESIVLVGDEGGPKGRSLTLEQATDTILFCSSIVHNLAHNAAAIAIDNQNPSDNNSSWPLIPATRKSDLNEPDPQTRNTTKRSSKSQKSRHKKDTETDPTKSPNNTEKNQGKIDQQKTRIVGLRDNGETKKPPLLESKCNCTIM